MEYWHIVFPFLGSFSLHCYTISNMGFLIFLHLFFLHMTSQHKVGNKKKKKNFGENKSGGHIRRYIVQNITFCMWFEPTLTIQIVHNTNEKS